MRSPHALDSRSAFVAGLICAALVGSCRSRSERATAGFASKPSAHQSGQRVPQAEARLALFLKGSLETSPPTETNLLMSCVPDGQTDHYLTLAKFQVLGSVLRGDTVDAAAEVTTVADETGAPHAVNRFVTKVRVRTDTLHWDMTRDSSNGQWGVCGYSREGFGFGHNGSDATTRWLPEGESWPRVHQLAESLATKR